MDGSRCRLYAPALRKQPLLPTEWERLGPRAYSCFREGKHLLSFFEPQLFRCPNHSLATIPMKEITALCELLYVIQRAAVYFVYLSSGFCSLDLSYNFSFCRWECGAYCAVWEGGHAVKKASSKRSDMRLTQFASFFAAEIWRSVHALRRQ